MKYFLIIQSAYSEIGLSRRRLAISRETSIRSLRSQIHKPVIHLAVNESDPCLAERLEAFRSTGCDVHPVIRNQWRLYGEDWELPAGRKIVGRLDDDDILSKDFCHRVYSGAPAQGNYCLIWPTGYVYWRSRLFRLTHVGNQFVSLVTDGDHNPHQEQHWQYPSLWPHVNVGGGYGWMWIRHGDAATSTLPRYRRRPLSQIDKSRFDVDLPHLSVVLNASGLASGNYHEHANQRELRYVLQENSANAPGSERVCSQGDAAATENGH